MTLHSRTQNALRANVPAQAIDSYKLTYPPFRSCLERPLGLQCTVETL